MNRVAVVAAGAPLTPGEIAELREFDHLIAVDGGFKYARAAGVNVKMLVGDFDSVTPQNLELAKARSIDIRAFDTEKDQSDLELALHLAAEVAGVEEIVVFGVGGGRPDHAMAATAAMAATVLDRVRISASLGDTRLYIVHDALTQDVGAGSTVSVLAYGGIAGGIVTRGLKWPLDDATLSPIETRGLSNVATGDQIEIRVDSGALLVYVTR